LTDSFWKTTAFALDSHMRVTEFHLSPHGTWFLFQSPITNAREPAGRNQLTIKLNDNSMLNHTSYAIRLLNACFEHIDLFTVVPQKWPQAIPRDC